MHSMVGYESVCKVEVEGYKLFFSPSIEFEILKFDVIQTVFIKWIFHLILNVIKRNQDKFADHNNKIGQGSGVVKPDFIYDGWSVNNREHIDKDQTIGLQTNGRSVGVNRDQVFLRYMDVSYESIYFLLYTARYFFIVFFKKINDQCGFLVNLAGVVIG